MGSEKVALLDPWQVWDDRGCFFVGLKAATTGQKWHRGYRVLVDAFGKRIAVRGSR